MNLNKYLQAVLVFRKAKASKPAAAPAVAVPPADLPAPKVLALAPLASVPVSFFGCTKCRNSETGCLQCNAAKATIAAAKRARAAAARDETK